MPGILSLEGAEKIRGEFLQSERAISYYLLIDSGKKRNLEKAVFFLLLVFSAFGSLSPGLGIFRAIPALLLLISAALVVLLYRNLLKNAKDNFQKEKIFLTEKNIIVQHSLQEKKVKYVPIEKFKGVRTRKLPFFGEFTTLEYLDGEGIDTLREPLYFLEKPDSFQDSAHALFERASKEKEQSEKKKG